MGDARLPLKRCTQCLPHINSAADNTLFRYTGKQRTSELPVPALTAAPAPTLASPSVPGGIPVARLASAALTRPTRSLPSLADHLLVLAKRGEKRWLGVDQRWTVSHYYLPLSLTSHPHKQTNARTCINTRMQTDTCHCQARCKPRQTTGGQGRGPAMGRPTGSRRAQRRRRRRAARPPWRPGWPPPCEAAAPSAPPPPPPSSRSGGRRRPPQGRRAPQRRARRQPCPPPRALFAAPGGRPRNCESSAARCCPRLGDLKKMRGTRVSGCEEFDESG